MSDTFDKLREAARVVRDGGQGISADRWEELLDRVDAGLADEQQD